MRRETGLAIEIVSRETEAKLAVSGCASLIDRNCDWVLVFDIGGGSSELIWLDLSGLNRPWRRSIYDRLDVQNCIAAWTSLPIGVVSLAERHGGREVTRANYEAMVADVMSGVAPFEAEHRFAERTAGRPPISSAPPARSRPLPASISVFRFMSAPASMAAGSARRGPHRLGQPDRHELCRSRGAALHRA